MTKRKQNNSWRCRYCGCEEIECTAYVNMNTNEIVSFEEVSDYYCPRCQEWFRGACEGDPCTNHDELTANCQRRRIP